VLPAGKKSYPYLSGRIPGGYRVPTPKLPSLTVTMRGVCIAVPTGMGRAGRFLTWAVTLSLGLTTKLAHYYSLGFSFFQDSFLCKIFRNSYKLLKYEENTIRPEKYETIFYRILKSRSWYYA
jgi:hypothetical protein